MSSHQPGPGDESAHPSDDHADDQVAQAVAAELETLSRACRQDPARLDAFLAPDFHEFGASGGELTRTGTADRVAASTADGGDDLVPEQVRGQLLADGVVMVKYRLSANGRTTHRTSLWRRTASGAWQMFHHQGTIVPPEAGQGEGGLH